MTDTALTQDEQFRLVDHTFDVAKRLLAAERDYRLEGDTARETKTVAAAVLWKSV